MSAAAGKLDLTLFNNYRTRFTGEELRELSKQCETNDETNEFSIPNVTNLRDCWKLDKGSTRQFWDQTTINRNNDLKEIDYVLPKSFATSIAELTERAATEAYTDELQKIAMFVDSHYGAFPDDTAEIYPASFSKSPQNSEENIVPIDSVVDASTRFVDFPSGLGMTIAKRPPSSSSIFEKIDKLSFANAADKVRVGLKRTSISFGLLLRTQSDRENCDVWKHTLYERDVEEKDVCINNDSDIPMQREVQRKENLVRMLKCETTEFGTRELFGKSAKLAKPFELNVNEIQQRTSEHDDFSNLLDFSQSYKNQFWNEMKLQSRDSYSSKKLKAPELPPPEPFFPDSNKHSNSSLRKLIKDHGFQMFTKSHMSQRELSLRWDPLKALSNLLPSEFLTQLITNRIDVLFDGVPTTLDSVAKIKSLYEISVDETETRQVNSDYDTEKLLSWAEQGVSLLIEILKSKKAKNSSKITKKREFERNDSEVIDLDEFDIRDNVESRKVKGEIEPVQIFSSPILDSTMESGAEEMFIKSSPNDVPWKFSKKVEPVKALKSGGSVLNDKSAGFPNKSNSTGALKLNRKGSNSSNRIESSSNIKKFSTLVGRNLQSNNTAGSESQTFDGSDILASNFSASDRVSKLMQFRGYHKRRKIVVKEAQNLTPAPVQPSNTMDSIAPKIEIEQMPVPEVNLLPVPTPWEKIETIQDLSSFDQQEKGQRHTYIASTNFALCRRDVVPILEQQMRIDLVEREFRYFRCGAKFLRDVDLIIDERTCVIIHPIISLSQNVPGGDVECLDEVNHLIELFWKQVEKMDVNDDLDSEEYDDEPIENVLLRISKKFSSINLILEHFHKPGLMNVNERNPNNLPDTFSPMVMKALERLNLFIAELSAHILNSNKSETKKNWTKKQLFADYEESHFDFHASEGNTIIPTEFTVQIFHSFSAEQSAYWIRYSGEIAADDCETPRVISGNDQTPAWKSRHSWENRDWLNREEVNQERFLCSFGAFNTINAQIVLKLSHSLYNLMNISLEDMIEAFSLWVSKQSLIDFYRKIHSTTNDDISVTRNVWA